MATVTIVCQCGKEIWQKAAGWTTLEEMRTAECSDCFLRAVRLTTHGHEQHVRDIGEGPLEHIKAETVNLILQKIAAKRREGDIAWKIYGDTKEISQYITACTAYGHANGQEQVLRMLKLI